MTLYKLVDIEKKEELLKKVEKLCKEKNCSVIDLLIMSMDAQRALKLNNNK